MRCGVVSAWWHAACGQIPGERKSTAGRNSLPSQRIPLHYCMRLTCSGMYTDYYLPVSTYSARSGTCTRKVASWLSCGKVRPPSCQWLPREACWSHQPGKPPAWDEAFTSICSPPVQPSPTVPPAGHGCRKEQAPLQGKEGKGKEDVSLAASTRYGIPPHLMCTGPAHCRPAP